MIIDLAEVGKPYPEAEWDDPDAWVMASGEAVLITDMTDSHLLNTIRMLKKMGAPYMTDAALSDFPSFQGEMAQDHAEWEWKKWVEAGQYCDQQYPKLVAERERRGL